MKDKNILNASDEEKSKGLYHLFFWGGIENDGLASSMFGDERNYWFSTPQERKTFKEKIESFAKNHSRIVCFSEDVGKHTWKRTIAVMDMVYNGKRYPFKYDFGYGYPEESARYMFLDGNYSCDCNRSLFLDREYPEDNILEFECGDSIIVENFRIIFKD